MEIIQKQVAFLYKTPFNGALETVALKVKEKLGNTDAVQYIPVPANLPPEIPRLVISYPDYNLTFSKNRVDLLLKGTGEIGTTVRILASILIEDLAIQIDRVGFVQKVFLEKELADLMNLLVNHESISTAKELNLRINTSKDIGGYSCNNIESLNFVNANKLDNGREVATHGILAERDINTLQENREGTLFTVAQIIALVPELESEANTSILTEYGD